MIIILKSIFPTAPKPFLLILKYKKEQIFYVLEVGTAVLLKGWLCKSSDSVFLIYN